jgi:hypothetical protein
MEHAFSPEVWRERVVYAALGKSLYEPELREVDGCYTFRYLTYLYREICSSKTDDFFSGDNLYVAHIGAEGESLSFSITDDFLLVFYVREVQPNVHRLAFHGVSNARYVSSNETLTFLRDLKFDFLALREKVRLWHQERGSLRIKLLLGEHMVNS